MCMYAVYKWQYGALLVMFWISVNMEFFDLHDGCFCDGFTARWLVRMHHFVNSSGLSFLEKVCTHRVPGSLTHSIVYNHVAMPTSFGLPFVVHRKGNNHNGIIYAQWSLEEYFTLAEPSVVQIESSLMIQWWGVFVRRIQYKVLGPLAATNHMQSNIRCYIWSHTSLYRIHPTLCNDVSGFG